MGESLVFSKDFFGMARGYAYKIIHNILLATNGIRVAGDDELSHFAVLLQYHDGLTLIGIVFKS